VTAAGAVVQLRRLAVVQRRRIDEHVHGDCPRGADGTCTWVAYERGILVGLWRGLEALGDEGPEFRR
jgi:hypothetical protein